MDKLDLEASIVKEAGDGTGIHFLSSIQNFRI